MIKNGVLYVATGKQSIAEVNQSILSLKKNMPNIHITVFTDTPNLISNKVDLIKKLKLTNNFKIDRLNCFQKTPYKNTLYLDADTYVYNDFNELFNILNTFNFAVAQSPISYDFLLKDIPDSFKQMNCGVMLYDNSKQTKKFFNEWKKTHRKLEKIQKVPGDETSFRKTMFFSKIRFTIFPNIYNFRINAPNLIYKNDIVKIFHGHNKEIKKIATAINKRKSAKFYIPKEKDKSSYKIYYI